MIRDFARLACLLASSLLFVLQACAVRAEELPRLAIIIDDLGYGLQQGRRIAQLPGPVAGAILPDTPHAAAVAALTHHAGKEVLLHLPMQSMNQQRVPLPGGIGLDTSRAEFSRVLRKHLKSIPYVTGINNHMGSLVTRHPGHMRWLMEEIGNQDQIFFVDSYTTKYSVAMAAAADFGIAALRRDVFLDPDPDPATVSREFARAIKLAKDNGFALAIGHPYPATLAFLEQKLPKLRAEGIELISLREMIRVQALAGALKTERGALGSD